MPRFFVDKITHPAVLSESESRHAVRALRLSVGDRVTVFDPAETWSGRIESLGNRVQIELLEKLDRARVGSEVAIASAVPKGSRLDWMVEKLAELGVGEFIPVRFARSVAELGAAKRRRLEKIAIAAAKQSGAPVLRIAPERPVDEIPPEAILACPEAPEELSRGSGMVLVGPEGGLTPEEARRFPRQGRLGPTILRIETAALVAAARRMS
jgi:16S rRNA (uracil1498-N3)-methyltransferase